MSQKVGVDETTPQIVDPARLDPACCKPALTGFCDLYLMRGRDGNEKIRAESPPRYNDKLMRVSKFYRDLRPGEGRLNNMEELSVISGVIKEVRRPENRLFLPLEIDLEGA